MCDIADHLRSDIRSLCDAVDKLRGNPPGTCERAVYFWHWDSDLTYLTDIDELLNLREDALDFLGITLSEIQLTA